MWNPKTQTPKLCDFDLSHFTGDERPTGFSNTGTWMFMADELLSKEAMLGMVERLYRHDFESFLAVLVHIMYCYEDGKQLRNTSLQGWHQTYYLTIASERRFTYMTIMNRCRPPAVPENLWVPTARTARDFSKYAAHYAEISVVLEDPYEDPLTSEQLNSLEQLAGLRFIEFYYPTYPFSRPNLGRSICVEVWREYWKQFLARNPKLKHNQL